MGSVVESWDPGEMLLAAMYEESFAFPQEGSRLRLDKDGVYRQNIKSCGAKDVKCVALTGRGVPPLEWNPVKVLRRMKCLLAEECV